jgi:homoaconitase/3-isopropylmalate dehydratase large subunit
MLLSVPVTSILRFLALDCHKQPVASTCSTSLQANLAVPDHNVPTTEHSNGVNSITDPISKLQVETLDKNCKKFGINEIQMNDIRQGIVHVIGSEQGATLPGMSIVCGDSHTSTLYLNVKFANI